MHDVFGTIHTTSIACTTKAAWKRAHQEGQPCSISSDMFNFSVDRLTASRTLYKHGKRAIGSQRGSYGQRKICFNSSHWAACTEKLMDTHQNYESSLLLSMRRKVFITWSSLGLEDGLGWLDRFWWSQPLTSEFDHRILLWWGCFVHIAWREVTHLLN